MIDCFDCFGVHVSSDSIAGSRPCPHAAARGARVQAVGAPVRSPAASVSARRLLGCQGRRHGRPLPRLAAPRASEPPRQGTPAGAPGPSRGTRPGSARPGSLGESEALARCCHSSRCGGPPWPSGPAAWEQVVSQKQPASLAAHRLCRHQMPLCMGAIVSFASEPSWLREVAARGGFGRYHQIAAAGQANNRTANNRT